MSKSLLRAASGVLALLLVVGGPALSASGVTRGAGITPSTASSPAAASVREQSDPGGRARSSAAWSAARWSWPVPAPHPLLTGFEAPAVRWSPGHRGIDVAAAPGTVVVAPDSGSVHFAGVVVDRPVLSLAHGDDVLSSFEPVVAIVARGDPVQRGQPIGVVQPGHCPTESCLHLGARVDGDYVSPLLLLGELRRAVLLPTGSEAQARG